MDSVTNPKPAGSETILSGPTLVTGSARFVRDEPRPEGLLFAAVVPSPVPCGRLIGIDRSAALELAGVKAVLEAGDIPGENQIGEVFDDEPLLASGAVNYAGQPVAVVVAETASLARRAAAAVKVNCEERDPVLTIEHALRLGQLYAPERRIERGDVEAGLNQADLVLEGAIHTPSQEHLYLETQSCRCLPSEDEEIIVLSATQSPADVQHGVARVLGLRANDVAVATRRLGGGFGGKETGATLWACLCALACHHLHRPVELVLSRKDDIAWTGKRHPFEIHYRAGFARDGRFLAYSVEFNINGGASADLSMAILERAMLHADNTYFIPNIRIVGRALRTNLPPNTAMRGFGAPQGIFAIEHVIERAALHLKFDPLEIRLRNAYRPGQETPFGQPVRDARTGALLSLLAERTGYEKLKAETRKLNDTSPERRRGIGIVPVKFGISFTASFKNQASALVLAYRDGTVSVSHGGVEMGQGVNTKVAQVVARELGLTLDRIRVESSDTKRIANASPTAASTGADLNGNAARIAAQRLAARLKAFAAPVLASGFAPDPSRIVLHGNAAFDERAPDRQLDFARLCSDAYRARVSLAAHGFYATPDIAWDREKGRGTPFSYFVFGCCLAMTETNLLTGVSRLVKVHIIHDTGVSLNPGIDRGQIAGAFFQGFGWTCREQLKQQDGRYLTDSLSTYKVPGFCDLPEEFVIELDQHPTVYAGVLGSKAVGEPPFIYGIAPFFAIRHTLESMAGSEVELAIPAVPESVLAALAATRP